MGGSVLSCDVWAYHTVLCRTDGEQQAWVGVTLQEVWYTSKHCQGRMASKTIYRRPYFVFRGTVTLDIKIAHRLSQSQSLADWADPRVVSCKGLVGRSSCSFMQGSCEKCTRVQWSEARGMDGSYSPEAPGLSSRMCQRTTADRSVVEARHV